jgi:putative Mn2+ efflux pump MntP
MPETNIPLNDNRYREGAGIGALSGLAISAAVLIPGFRESGLNIATGLEAVASGTFTLAAIVCGAKIGEGIRRNR